MLFEWNPWWYFLIPSTILWVLFLGYSLRELATIKYWELVTLLLLCTLPLHWVYFLAGARGLPIYLIILVAWIGLYFFRKDKKRVGCVSREGYLRLLGVGRKKGRLVKNARDLEAIDLLVLSNREFASLTSSKKTALKTRVLEALQLDVEVLSISSFLQSEYGYIDAGGNLDASVVGVQRRRILRGTKRVIDIFLSVLIITVFFPVIALVALAIVLLDGFPVFFKQQRLGKGGRRFEILKFRTMLPNEKLNIRATGLGTVLRQTHLDELPQLLNIIRGDMAFVGPRPEWVLLSTPEVAPKNYWLRQAIRPGLTGWAQVNYKPSRTKKMRKRKLGYDLYYLHNRSVFLDILIWFRTFQRLPLFFYAIFEKNYGAV